MSDPAAKSHVCPPDDWCFTCAAADADAHDGVPPRSPGGLFPLARYRHGDHECWALDLDGSGKLFLACDCDLLPVELAALFDIPPENLHDVEVRVSARTIAERTIATDPDNRPARAVLALLGT